MNTSIMSAGGEVAFVGPYLLTGPTSQGMIVRWILEHGDEPVEPGDAFLTNDPYVGAAHQNCVTVTAPIHDGDRLIAWAGATLHVVDVGGPTAGQVGIGAQSILDEAPPIAPLRIVRGGQVVPEAETAYIGRSRTPELNALDLRAKIAAINAVAAGIAELVTRYGAETFVEVVETVIASSAEHLKRRLAGAPGRPRASCRLRGSRVGRRPDRPLCDRPRASTSGTIDSCLISARRRRRRRPSSTAPGAGCSRAPSSAS